MLGVDGNHEYHLTKKGVIEVEPTSVSKVQIAQVVTEMTPIVVVDEVKTMLFLFYRERMFLQKCTLLVLWKQM